MDVTFLQYCLPIRKKCVQNGLKKYLGQLFWHFFRTPEDSHPKCIALWQKYDIIIILCATKKALTLSATAALHATEGELTTTTITITTITSEKRKDRESKTCVGLPKCLAASRGGRGVDDEESNVATHCCVTNRPILSRSFLAHETRMRARGALQRAPSTDSLNSTLYGDDPAPPLPTTAYLIFCVYVLYACG